MHLLHTQKNGIFWPSLPLDMQAHFCRYPRSLCMRHNPSTAISSTLNGKSPCAYIIAQRLPTFQPLFSGTPKTCGVFKLVSYSSTQESNFVEAHPRWISGKKIRAREEDAVNCACICLHHFIPLCTKPYALDYSLPASIDAYVINEWPL